MGLPRVRVPCDTPDFGSLKIIQGLSLCSNWGLAYNPNQVDTIEKQIRNIRGAAHFILILTPGCLDSIIQVRTN